MKTDLRKTAAAIEFAGPVVYLLVMGQLAEAFGYFDEARRCVVRVMGPAHRHPFIGLYRSSDLLLAWLFWFDQCIFLVKKKSVCILWMQRLAVCPPF
jgi:hypothetical protein